MFNTIVNTGIIIVIMITLYFILTNIISNHKPFESVPDLKETPFDILFNEILDLTIADKLTWDDYNYSYHTQYKNFKIQIHTVFSEKLHFINKKTENETVFNLACDQEIDLKKAIHKNINNIKMKQLSI